MSKTRPYRDKKDMTCPKHRVQVKLNVRRLEDEDGRSHFGGYWYGCPEGWTKCKYYVQYSERANTEIMVSTCYDR